MLAKLEETLKLLPAMLDNFELWDSLIVNRRKPFTYRVFAKTPDGFRVCLHRFEECDMHEAFPHPHPWPGAFIILRGRYRMGMGSSANLVDKPKNVTTLELTKHSKYEIIEPTTWHSVMPLETTYTVMINGEPWEKGVVHEAAPTTKGKDLDKMPEADLRHHLAIFKHLLKEYK